jgi:hypothetical protein
MDLGFGIDLVSVASVLTREPLYGTKLRLDIQLASNRIGFGIGYRLVPVIDLTIGVQGLWDLKDGSIQPGVYVSIWRF